MNEDSAGLRHDFRQGALARRQGRLAQGHDAAVAQHVLLLRLWRIFRHHNVGLGAAQLRRPRDRGGMIARGMRGDAALQFRLRQSEDGIGRPAGLEGARLLEVFTLEVKRRTEGRIQGRTGHDRRAADVIADAGMRGANIVKSK
jgi:hypothetical protein